MFFRYFFVLFNIIIIYFIFLIKYIVFLFIIFN